MTVISEDEDKEIDEYIAFLHYMGEEDMFDKDWNPFEDRLDYLIDEF